jgi:hypothetical protein
VNGTWLLQLYVGIAAYDRSAPAAPPSQTRPTQNAGIPDPRDSVSMRFNGREQVWVSGAANCAQAGRKSIIQ